MDSANAISEFLSSRRGRTSSDQAGLPSDGQRRVPGCAASKPPRWPVSPSSTQAAERGNRIRVFDTVPEALARALELDDAERPRLFDLARAAGPAVDLLASWTATPAEERPGRAAGA